MEAMEPSNHIVQFLGQQRWAIATVTDQQYHVIQLRSALPHLLSIGRSGSIGWRVYLVRRPCVSVYTPVLRVVEITVVNVPTAVDDALEMASNMIYSSRHIRSDLVDLITAHGLVSPT
jgi:hypothetical protein